VNDDVIDATLASLRPTYLARRRDELPALQQALANCDLDDAARMSHKIAGSAATYGFAELSALARELEAASLEKRGEDAAALCAALADHLATLG
jgi:HPt (histidine-containing phosphotransfer) domain-containing protein